MFSKVKNFLISLTAVSVLMLPACSSDDSESAVVTEEEEVSLTLDKSGELSLTGVIPAYTTETFKASLENAQASIAFTAASSAVEAVSAGADSLTVDFLLPGTSTITASAIVDGEIYSDSVAVTVAFADASECGLTLSAPEDELGENSAQVTWAALDTSYGSLDCYILALYDSEENLVYFEKIEADEASDTNTVSWTDLTAQSSYTAKVYTVFTKDNLTSYGLSTVSFSTTDDITAPGDVTLTSAVADETTVSLAWTNPSDDDLAAIVITPYVMASGASEYTALDTVIITDTSVISYEFTDLTATSTYKYLIQAKDTNDNISTGVTTDELLITGDITAPGEVTITSASADVTTVSLEWTNPSDDDFAAIIITP
ncbi:fibronectin type III domain-containing protein, partial [Treponema sp.]|uniref:fibronectin type III domain-containing protein n=1 Tax=Treponema sp. TaxID=166 RepID=UPI00345BD743|nr:fibronectin type III domain-containing protein [Treponema sp.]